MKKSQKKAGLWIIGIFLLGLVTYAAFPEVKTKVDNAVAGTSNMIEIANYYDKNGNPISTPLAMVSGREGVYFIDFNINIKNTGELPLTFAVSGSPSSFDAAIKQNISGFSLAGAGMTTKRTGKVDVSKENGSVTYSLTALGSYVYGGETKTISKTASVVLDIKPDPLAGFSVDIGSINGGSTFQADYIKYLGESIKFDSLTVGTATGTGTTNVDGVNNRDFFAQLNGQDVDLVFDRLVSAPNPDSWPLSGSIPTVCSQGMRPSGVKYIHCYFTATNPCQWGCQPGEFHRGTGFTIVVDGHVVLPSQTSYRGINTLSVNGTSVINQWGNGYSITDSSYIVLIQ